MLEILPLLLALQIPLDDAAEVSKRVYEWAEQHAIARPLGYGEEFVLGAPWEPSVGSTRETLEFQAAVEEWVADAAPAARRDLLPPDVRAAIDRLGASSWRERDAASKGLEAMLRTRGDAARWLFVARRSRDAEVALRCQHILIRLNPCRTCKGRGWEGSQDYQWSCMKCDGGGSEWFRGAWD